MEEMRQAGGERVVGPKDSLLPFLKWAGGKRWLAGDLQPYLAQFAGTYFEPFLGSGAVFFHHRPARAVLSDANDELIECYQAIRDNPETVEAELRILAQRSPETDYYAVRAERPPTSAERAARFLYLNRTCWNGLYRVNLRGDFNVPRGTKTQILLPTDDFQTISEALQAAKILTSDFEDVIEMASEGDIVFADPPYTVAHNMNGFVKYNQKIFSWSDQVRLADCLKNASVRGVCVIATNADHPKIRALYRDGFRARPVARASVIAASAEKRRVTTELLITNLTAII